MATIVKYSHHFTVTGWHVGMWNDMKKFIVRFQQYATRYQKGRGLIRESKKVFAESNASRTIVRLHINKFDDFMEFMTMRGYTSKDLTVTEVPLYEPATINPVMPDFMVPRDYQEPQIEYVCEDGKIKILTLQTGKGKTFCALEAIRRLKQRTLISIPAKYLDKWVKDVIEAYGDSVKIMVIKGGGPLRSMLAQAEEGEIDADIIICSSNTLANYIKEFRGNGVFTYEVPPYKFFEKLKVGVRLIDEVHEGLHFNYRFDCYTHVPKTISLSATIVSRDETVNTVVRYMFPNEIRGPEMEYDRYTDVTAIGYKVAKPNLVKYKNAGMYSHHVYEQWIFSREERLEAYTDYIFHLIEAVYINKGNLKQKMLVYAASVDMCKHLATEFSKRYPELEIGTKVADDDFDILDTAQVIFSTLLSTGTAVDVDDLAYVLMTTSIDSDQANLQAIGRLRRLKNYPDQTPEFYYIVCTDIDKQMNYHTNKQKLFEGKAKHQTYTLSSFILP